MEEIQFFLIDSESFTPGDAQKVQEFLNDMESLPMTSEELEGSKSNTGGSTEVTDESKVY